MHLRVGTEFLTGPPACTITQDRGKPLHMGPIWDYNEAFGLCCGYPIDGYENDVSTDQALLWLFLQRELRTV